MLTFFDTDEVEMQRNREKMLGMKNHFDTSGSIEIREVDIAGVACLQFFLAHSMQFKCQFVRASVFNLLL